MQDIDSKTQSTQKASAENGEVVAAAYGFWNGFRQAFKIIQINIMQQTWFEASFWVQWEIGNKISSFPKITSVLLWASCFCVEPSLLCLVKLERSFYPFHILFDISNIFNFIQLEFPAFHSFFFTYYLKAGFNIYKDSSRGVNTNFLLGAPHTPLISYSVF